MNHYRILTLNQISAHGLSRFPSARYTVGKAVDAPDAIVLRSFDLHSTPIAPSVKAIGRAGAGTNNIPVAEMSQRGVPVFNAPGANANAVKELVLAGLFLAARNICQAWDYVRTLEGDDHALEAAMEQGKKKFVGYELPGRTLGVVGLGAIGVEAKIDVERLKAQNEEMSEKIEWGKKVEKALKGDAILARTERNKAQAEVERARQRVAHALRDQLAVRVRASLVGVEPVHGVERERAHSSPSMSRPCPSCAMTHGPRGIGQGRCAVAKAARAVAIRRRSSVSCAVDRHGRQHISRRFTRAVCRARDRFKRRGR